MDLRGDGCPVEAVPNWYWRLCDTALMTARGWTAPESYREAVEIQHLEAAQAQSAAAERAAARQQEEMRSRARQATGGV